MTTNNLGKKVVSTAVSISLLFPNIAMAEKAFVKEETVYVDLEDDGRAREIISSVWIHSDDKMEKFEDRTNLKDIVNIKGEEEPELKNGKAIWDVKDKDLYYQGSSDKSLPLDARITYFLDGKKVKPEDIAGESGRLEINIDFKNKDLQEVELKSGRKKTIYSPYIVATVVDLPMENFKNVKVNTGKILSDGSDDILTFISMPGLKESLDLDSSGLDISDNIKISADVREFQMKPIIMAMTSEIPEIDAIDKADDLDSLMDGMDKLTEAGDKLTEATSALHDGQLELDLGLQEFASGVDRLSSGSKKLLAGSNDLSKGLDSAYRGSLQLKEGGDSLGKSSKQLAEGYDGLGRGMVEFSNKSGELAEGVGMLSQGVMDIPENLNKLSLGMKEIVSNTGKLEEGQKDLNAGLKSSVDGVRNIKDGKIQEKEAIDGILVSINQMEELVALMSQLEGGKEISTELSQGLAQQKEVLSRISGSSDQLVRGLEDLELGLKEAEKGSGELLDGLGGLKAGQEEAFTGMNQMAAASGELNSAAEELSQGSKALKEGSREIADNTIRLNDGFGQLSEGTGQFISSTSELSRGLNSLNQGSLALKTGIEGLNDGGNQLSMASRQLRDGSKKLVDGSGELNKGMEEFSQEGISKIEEKFENGNLDIVEIIEIKDRLVDLSKKNNSFSGIDDKMDGKVKYIMKTESIKFEEEIKEDKLEEEREDNFFKRLIDKIK